MSHSAKRTILVVFGACLALPLAGVVLAFLGRSPMPLVDEALNRVPAKMVSWSGLRSAEPVVIGQWPPALDETYPDLILSDQNGETVHLSDFAGKTILLELAAVPCKGCQAFAGGREFGGFAGVPVQAGLDSIHHYAERYAGVTLGKEDSDVVLVQLLLYGKSMSSPSQQETSDWARHFELEREHNEVVLRGDPSMLGKATYHMIPGFHLIDKDFVLRRDSSGHRPQHDLYRDLLPELSRLAR